MKILYICNFESPYRVEFWNELSKYCDVTVLFSESKEQQTNRNKQWFNNTDYSFYYIYLKQKKIIKNKHICFDVTKYIKDQSYDLIIFHPYSPLTCVYGIFYCIFHKIPYIINSDGGFPKSGKGLGEKLKYFLISHACAFTSTSKQTDDYLAFYGGNRNQMYRYTLTTLHQSEVDKNITSIKEKEQLRTNLGINEKYVILSVGNMIYRKGFDLLLKAALSVNKNIGFYIVGDTPTEDYLEFCNKNDLRNVHFVKFKQKKELHSYFRASDIFVLPTREDIWGLVIVEAMSAGLPIITTDRCIAGLELIENGKNGYIYPVNDINLLSQYINKLCENEDLRRNFAIESLKKSQDISIEEMAKKHFEIFQEILINNRR